MYFIIKHISPVDFMLSLFATHILMETRTQKIVRLAREKNVSDRYARSELSSTADEIENSKYLFIILDCNLNNLFQNIIVKNLFIVVFSCLEI